MSHLSPARRAAVLIGRAVRERNAYASEVAHALLSKTKLSPADRAFALKLSLGVTATMGTLDEVINKSLRNPDDITPEVRDAMRISVYEMIYLDKQDHAAVDQGVELVRSVAPKAAGLANAVLRKIAKSAEAFPYGNPEINNQALARQYAFPLWLAKRLIGELGREEAIQFMKISNMDAPIFLSNNACAPEGFSWDALCEDGTVTPHETLDGCYLLNEGSAITGHPLSDGLRNGSVLVSDEAAQSVVDFVIDEKQPESFLEIGCGRGTKTVLLQSQAQRKYGQQMKLTSVDNYQFKVDIVKKRAAASGIQLEDAVVADATHLDKTFDGQLFDAVFIDAPCSGMGTLRRHPEIRWRRSQKDVTMLADIGFAMLHEAAKHVNVDGELTYATCTILREENEDVINRFMKTKVGEAFKVVKTMRTQLTEGGPDAHFAVKFVRIR